MTLDAVELEILRGSLQSVAKEMGATLGRTAFSPNIKERKDFSCAIFDAEGEMVSQAEHIPVHLGSMPLSVKESLREFTFTDGDMVLLNDPYWGGTHLPDITLITPIFCGDLLGFAACRAHHADVGGKAPGSMPGDSREVFEEGIIIPPVKLYAHGTLNEDIFRLIIRNVRTPEERKGDLKAQVSACEIGKRRIGELVEKYGHAMITESFGAIMDYSERRMIKKIDEFPTGTYSAHDFMDGDGISDDPVRIAVIVTTGDSTLNFNFQGTDDQREGNINAVYAVTLSCVYYTVRCVTDPRIPPNAGCYRPLQIRVPKGCLLNPAHPHAVSAGNVETSQRIVDVLLRAFSQIIPERVVAGCQGTMNNVTIGGTVRGEPFAYYETIGGGMGARHDRKGIDGVHVHMSNTLNTPIEALEMTYPFLIREYSLRDDSGGRGKFNGGMGIVRSTRVLTDCTLSIQSDRRKFAPYGLFGGEDGCRGKNILIRNGEEIPLPSKTTYQLKKGDILRIETPGGGGYGSPTHPDRWEGHET
ncbi:MAG: hydantoinase B/oxoprolinase family protein [Theionarchaea archaeon]|nr:hydantoinase B/oxoprolinase family protein [Theionarchaea archaeon]